TVVVATQEDGSIDPAGTFSQGLFVGDTRFLSRFRIYLDGLAPSLMGSGEETLYQAGYIHTNPALPHVTARSFGLVQRTAIQNGMVTITLAIRNMTIDPVEFELSIDIDADFHDLFETRGVKREKRGEMLPVETTGTSLRFQYRGLDDATRTTHIGVEPPMDRWEKGRLFFPIALEPDGRHFITLKVNCRIEVPEGSKPVYGPQSSGTLQPGWFESATTITVSNPIVDQIVRRSVEDLGILLTEFPDGLWVPAAGLPRFPVPFGRDSAFTGIMTLSWNPRIAHDVLSFLGRLQGTEENPYNYEQPGKVVHEMHTGELARLMEIPFGLFYGSVDSTPLFLLLVAEYLTWTGDLALYRQIKPNLDAAWQWIAAYGDIDGSGYVQYQAHTPPRIASAALTVGLFNQGWKDSADAVSYRDGTLCTDHPVALAEVQGYLYRALQLWGTLYQAMPASEGMAEEGTKLLARAARLKEQFNREFWMPEQGYYAMALDGHHRQVDTITSNPGHCLWTGLIDEERAGELARVLMSGPMAGSWGIRTMAETEKRHNPISYHNGSVWPFENALIGAGLRRYGYIEEADSIFNALVDASGYFEYRRWPEVYAGVPRDLVTVLSRQPDASRPQAWSAASIFLWIQSWLGLSPTPFSREVEVAPALPDGIETLRVKDVAVGDSHLSLTLSRTNGATQLQVDENPGNLQITLRPIKEG
ncbi:MAG TPA: glycogen debranching N-terminal domain-containing protein, partial [Chloroflexota bacterium]